MYYPEIRNNNDIFVKYNFKFSLIIYFTHAITTVNIFKDNRFSREITPYSKSHITVLDVA